MSAYGDKLAEMIDKYKMRVRGNNGIAEQSHLDPARVEAIIAGKGEPCSDAEHRKLCRAMPHLKAWGNLLIEKHMPMARAANDLSPIETSPAQRFAPVSEAVPQLPVRKRVEDPKEAPQRPSIPSSANPPSQPEPGKVVPMNPSSRPRRTFASFGKALYVLRCESKSSIEEVAATLSVSDSAVRAWEDDLNKPTDANHKQLVTLFPDLAYAPKPSGRGREVEREERASHVRESLPRTPNAKEIMMFAMKNAPLLSNPNLTTFLDMITEARDLGLTIEDLADLARENAS